MENEQNPKDKEPHPSNKKEKKEQTKRENRKQDERLKDSFPASDPPSTY
ncbi:hypothetical protein ACQUW5_01495 [Legionella sp. CNM-1927-20]